MKDTRWYFNRNLKPLGPFTYEEMRAKIHRGELGLHDLICAEPEGAWKPAHEWRCFEETLFPSRQGLSFSAADNSKKDWILLVGTKHDGPYSILELKAMLQRGVLQPTQMVWKSGLSGWCQLQERQELYLEASLESP